MTPRGGNGFRTLDRRGVSALASILYFYDGWQCVEETDDQGVVAKRYFFGEGLDEVVKATIPEPTGVDIDNDTVTGESAVDVYYHHDSLGSVVAVSNAAGDVEESYRYTAYGEVSVFDEGGSPVSGTVIEQPFMYTGRRQDFEEDSGLFYYRLRYYDPAAGRFVSRDPLGAWGDPAQRGNEQNYCGNNAVNRVDPLGLDDQGARLPRAALPHLARYLEQGRPRLLRGSDPGQLLVTKSGRPLLRRCAVYQIVRKVGERAGVRCHPHALRRSLASHLVEEGVSVRTVQVLLGHEGLATTALYLEVDRGRLRKAVGVLERGSITATE